MIKTKFICTLFLLSIISIFPQTTYYVSSSQGNDSNPGTSINSPFMTIEKVNQLNLIPGDNILFKKGDVWQGEVLIIKNSGSSSNRITFGAYSSGSKPIITLKQQIPAWNNVSTWNNNGNNVWYMQMPSHDQYNPIQRLWLNGKEVFFASSDNGDGTSGVNSKWEFQQSTNGRLYVYAPENPANYFSNIEYPGGASTSHFYCHTIELINADYVTLDGLDIRGSMYSSLGLAGSDYVTIKNCNVGNASNWTGIYGNSTFINDLLLIRLLIML